MIVNYNLLNFLHDNKEIGDIVYMFIKLLVLTYF